MSPSPTGKAVRALVVWLVRVGTEWVFFGHVLQGCICALTAGGVRFLKGCILVRQAQIKGSLSVV